MTYTDYLRERAISALMILRDETSSLNEKEICQVAINEIKKAGGV